MVPHSANCDQTFFSSVLMEYWLVLFEINLFLIKYVFIPDYRYPMTWHSLENIGLSFGQINSACRAAYICHHFYIIVMGFWLLFYYILLLKTLFCSNMQSEVVQIYKRVKELAIVDTSWILKSWLTKSNEILHTEYTKNHL